jgi:serine/threonine-protein kinase
MNELAGQSLGGYLLEEEVGHGSMGVVYRGQQIALGREVAIKVLPQGLAKDPSYVARFIREAHIIAGLNHPNIVHIYDAGRIQKLLYFVMEFVQGPTLASLLYLDGVIPPYLAAEYAAQIADALDAAYSERHVIHRDIKPENLMLNRWGKVKVMDFGLARAPGHQAITVAKTLVGSIYYSSPEQIWGQTLDNRSDIYALAVVLYEMVSGQRPFGGRTMPEITQNITGGNLYPPSVYNPNIPSGLEQVIMRALARDRNQRHLTAGLLAQELRRLNLHAPDYQTASSPSGSLPKQNGQPPVVQPPRRPTWRPRYLDGEQEPVNRQLEHQPTRETGAMRPVPPLPEIHAQGTGAHQRLDQQQAEHFKTVPLHNPQVSFNQQGNSEYDDNHRNSHRPWSPLQRMFRPPPY